jgi:hypothetical protein
MLEHAGNSAILAGTCTSCTYMQASPRNAAFGRISSHANMVQRHPYYRHVNAKMAPCKSSSCIQLQSGRVPRRQAACKPQMPPCMHVTSEKRCVQHLPPELYQATCHNRQRQGHARPSCRLLLHMSECDSREPSAIKLEQQVLLLETLPYHSTFSLQLLHPMPSSGQVHARP